MIFRVGGGVDMCVCDIPCVCVDVCDIPCVCVDVCDIPCVYVDVCDIPCVCGREIRRKGGVLSVSA